MKQGKTTALESLLEEAEQSADYLDDKEQGEGYDGSDIAKEIRRLCAVIKRQRNFIKAGESFYSILFNAKACDADCESLASGAADGVGGDGE